MKRRKKHQPYVMNTIIMANLAFLCLLFFQFTYPETKEEGIKHVVPPKISCGFTVCGPIRHDILDIRVNLNNQLLVEGKLSDVNHLYGIAKEFLTNKNNEFKYPSFNTITLQRTKDQVDYWKEQSDKAAVNSPEQVVAEKKLEEWQVRLITLQEIDEPQFRQISKMAVMTIDMDEDATYGRYIEILSELRAAQNDLRDEYSQKYFGKSFDSLDPEKDARKILAIQTLVPHRIIKKY